MYDGLNYLHHINITEIARVMHEERVARVRTIRLAREAAKARRDAPDGRPVSADRHFLLMFRLRSLLFRLAPRLASRMLL